MPDDETTVLVWSAHFHSALLAYHDCSLFEYRETGWVGEHGQPLLNITHYCADILPPSPSDPHA